MHLESVSKIEPHRLPKTTESELINFDPESIQSLEQGLLNLAVFLEEKILSEKVITEIIITDTTARPYGSAIKEIARKVSAKYNLSDPKIHFFATFRDTKGGRFFEWKHLENNEGISLEQSKEKFVEQKTELLEKILGWDKSAYTRIITEAEVSSEYKNLLRQLINSDKIPKAKEMKADQKQVIEEAVSIFREKIKKYGEKNEISMDIQTQYYREGYSTHTCQYTTEAGPKIECQEAYSDPETLLQKILGRKKEKLPTILDDIDTASINLEYPTKEDKKILETRINQIKSLRHIWWQEAIAESTESIKESLMRRYLYFFQKLVCLNPEISEMNADEFLEFLLQEKTELSKGKIADLENYKQAEAKLVARVDQMKLKPESNILVVDEFTETSTTFSLVFEYIQKATELHKQKMPEISCFVMERNPNFPQATFRYNGKDQLVENGGSEEVSNYWRWNKSFNTGVSKPENPLDVTGYAKAEHYNSKNGLDLRQKLREIAQNISQVI
jgi:hypothetical protein